MRFLLLLWLLFLWTQDTHGSTTVDPSIDATLLKQQKLSKELLGLADLWNSVKNSAVNAWKSIKSIAKRTEERITRWIQSVKVKANKINISFKDSIQDLKNEIRALIANMKVTSVVVKKCIQKEQEAIEEILRIILKSVTTCISQSIQRLSALELPHTHLIDKEEFIANIESELYLCLNIDDIEQCLNNVRKTMYDQLEQEEEDILKIRDETRATTDEILNIIASCASKGLVDASGAVANTTIHIIKCITKT